MSSTPSLWSFIIHAGFLVKLVMLLLMSASIASWALIFQRSRLLKKTALETKKFETLFWSGVDLNQLYQQLSEKKQNLSGISDIFYSGFHEYSRLRQQAGMSAEAIMAGTERAMRITQTRTQEQLESNISLLATIGSTSPYVGLFGTVWGIMTSFQALNTVQQATISMVAPGISEALIATAIGLFAAIPAVVGYNRLSNSLEKIEQQFDLFQEELLGILHRKVHH